MFLFGKKKPVPKPSPLPSINPALATYVRPKMRAGMDPYRIAQAYNKTHPEQITMEDAAFVCSYINTKDELKSLRSCDAKTYEVIVANDKCTCPVCAKYKNKFLPLKGAKIGENCPPFHKGCRCVIGIGI